MGKIIKTLLRSFPLFLLSWQASADGSSIGKIYQPYVEMLGREIELEALGYSSDSDQRRYRLGVGIPLAEKFSVEFSAIAEAESGSSTDVEGYEAELKWQLTEQGEYFADFGVMFELEREPEVDLCEGTILILINRDIGRTTLTANPRVSYEDDRELGGEWETSLALKWRYRYRQWFEPSLEYFKSEDTNAFGPVLNGLYKVGIGKSLQWELGLLWELDSENSVDRTLKARVEYEF